MLTRGVARAAPAPKCASIRAGASGRLATLYLLDDRQYRDPQVCTRGRQARDRRRGPGRLRRLERSGAQHAGRWRRSAGWTAALARPPRRGWTVIGQQTAVRPARLPARARRSCSGTTAGTATRARTRLTECAAPARSQPGAAGRRRARELGRACEGRLRAAGQPGARRRILRHQHHLAHRRQGEGGRAPGRESHTSSLPTPSARATAWPSSRPAG